MSWPLDSAAYMDNVWDLVQGLGLPFGAFRGSMRVPLKGSVRVPLKGSIRVPLKGSRIRLWV